MTGVFLVATSQTAATDPLKRPGTTTTERPGIFSTSELGDNELVELLAERFGASPVRVLDSDNKKIDRSIKVVSESFELTTDFKYNPKVRVVYSIPLRSNSTAGPDADNIVLQAFWPVAMQPFKTETVNGREEQVPNTEPEEAARNISYKCGYTAFSIYITSPREMWSDPRESYFQGGREWVDLVFRAQDEIIKRHKLKAKGLLLMGHSLGGTFVQRIAAARPDRVAGIAVFSAPEITLPTEKSDTAWFLGITRGDSMRREYERLYGRLVETTANVVFNIFPPNYERRGAGANFYHSFTQLGVDACRSFLRGVVSGMSPQGDVDVTKWPYIRDRNKPLRIFPIGHQNAKKIPTTDREYLPSREFVEILQSLPAPLQFVNLPNGQGGTIKCSVGLPPLGRPRGVILYCQSFDFRNLPQIFDNIYYLAENGYVVIAPRLDKMPQRTIATALEFVRTAKVFQRVPLALLGNGPVGSAMWQTAALDRRIQPKAVAVMEFEPGDLLDESKLPPGCGIKSPVMFVYDEALLTNVSTSTGARASLERVSTIKGYIAACKERSQLARVSFVPKDTESPGMVAQKSVQASADFLTKVIENRVSEIAP